MAGVIVHLQVILFAISLEKFHLKNDFFAGRN